jgi:hypothetical protein
MVCEDLSGETGDCSGCVGSEMGWLGSEGEARDGDAAGEPGTAEPTAFAGMSYF